MNENEKTSILVQALPYIQTYSGKIIVIKYGGNAMINDELKLAVISDIVLLTCVGIKVVLVHGGGPEISDMLSKIGKESKFINGLRYTDEESIEIVQMVLCGKVNKDLVSLIQGSGGKAVGICGLDGGLLKAKKLLGNGVDYGFVGDITEVNTEIITNITDKGNIPVIATVAGGENGEVYNINADTAAAKIASALKAERLISLTDVVGVLKNPNDESTLIKKINVSEVPRLIKDGVISGGMKPKIDCCVEAIRQGVKSAVIVDGRVPHSILMEMFSDEGSGTMIV